METEINFIEDNFEDTDIVTLDTAKYLKQHGFNLATHHYYLDKNLSFVEKGLKRVKMGKRRMNHNKYDDFIYSAPTRKEFMDWIRLYHKNFNK